MNNNKTDFGTCTSQFAKVDCKKIVFDVQSKIAPVINRAKNKIGNAKLVAIKNGEKGKIIIHFQRCNKYSYFLQRWVCGIALHFQ